MAILNLYRQDNSYILSLSLKQILALCGNGELKDGAATSLELREYLSLIKSEKIFEYIEACLTAKLDKGGLILQDLINELGRRLEYTVENGRYQGVVGKSNHDGLWKKGEGHSFVVEVKTTDAYRINLDTLADYRSLLITTGEISGKSSLLIVVGRQDTGDLEAQIRGSRHAWDIRLISVDALIKLVRLKEGTEDNTTSKIHEILQPFEYTRLDRIVELAFTAAQEKEEDTASVDPEEKTGAPETTLDRLPYAPSPDIDATRAKILDAFKKVNGIDLVKKSKALYWSPDSDHKYRVVCTVSKQYKTGYYWYAFHEDWQKYLEAGAQGVFVIGCVDRNEYYAIPLAWIMSKLNLLSETQRPDGRKFWHVHVNAANTESLSLSPPAGADEISLKEFRLVL